MDEDEFITSRTSRLTTHNPQLTNHRLLLASANPGKLREFQAATAPLGIEVKTLPRFCQFAPCIEDGETFEENARKKALYYSALTSEMIFADDSGLCVDALGGAPGVHSARYGGPNASDEQNNRKLLEELRRIEAGANLRHGPHPQAAAGPTRAGHRPATTIHAAHYVCVIALAKQGQIMTVAEGHADGSILDEPRGAGGFGYDPHFYYPPLGKTFAELTADEKFVVSHRGAAFRELLEFLKSSRLRDL